MPNARAVMTTLDPKLRHKPSQKLTLEEVLKSLQDLIHTELLENEHAPETAVRQAGFSSEAQPPYYTTPVDEAFSMANVSADLDNLNDVVRSLSELIAKELDTAHELDLSLTSALHPADHFAQLDESPVPNKQEFSSEVTQATPAVLSMTTESVNPVELVPELISTTSPRPEGTTPNPQMLTPLGTQQDLFLVETSPAIVTSQAADNSTELTLTTPDPIEEMTLNKNIEDDSATLQELPRDFQDTFESSAQPFDASTAMEMLETADNHSHVESNAMRSMDFVDETITTTHAITNETKLEVRAIPDQLLDSHQTTTSVPSSDTPPTPHSLLDAEVSMSAIVSAPATAPVRSADDFLSSDIPVLHDIFSAPPSAVGLALLSPERARDAVIRAIAKLNIEMRQSGDRGLDPKIVHRLQNFVRLELEQATKK